MRRMNIVAGVVIIASLAGGVVYYRQAEEKKDVQPPVLHAESEELTVSIAATEEELTAGISAEDDRDKDVSDSILITGIEKKREQTRILRLPMLLLIRPAIWVH